MPNDERKSFLLRITPALWNELEKWAGDELRSVNGQIEYVLRPALQKRRGGSTTAAAAAKKSTAPPAGKKK